MWDVFGTTQTICAGSNVHAKEINGYLSADTSPAIPISALMWTKSPKTPPCIETPISFHPLEGLHVSWSSFSLINVLIYALQNLPLLRFQILLLYKEGSQTYWHVRDIGVYSWAGERILRYVGNLEFHSISQYCGQIHNLNTNKKKIYKILICHLTLLLLEETLTLRTY